MRNFSQKLFLFIVICFSLLTSCAEEDAKDLVCGGNGEMHDDHCDCDSGYVLSDDGNSCDPAPESEEVQYGGDFVFEASEIQASTGTDNNSQIWLLEARADDVHLKIEIYEQYGGISSPGSITIDDVEANYATCGTCLLLQTGCAAHGDHFHCERTFMPKVGGEVHIDKIGTNAGDELAGELLGVVFQEVTIGQNYQSQPVVDGEEIALTPWSFDTLLEEFASRSAR